MHIARIMLAVVLTASAGVAAWAKYEAVAKPRVSFCRALGARRRSNAFGQLSPAVMPVTERIV